MADYTVKQSDFDNFKNNDATLKVNGVEIEVGSGINSGDSLVATCNSGKKFYTQSNDPNTSVYVRSTDKHGKNIYQLFKLNESETEGTHTWSRPYGGTLRDINCSTIEIPEPEIPLYRITETDINNINNCVVKNNGTDIYVDMPIYDGNKLTLQCVDGYSLYDNSAYMYYRDGLGTPKYMYFEISSDKLSGNLTINKLDSGSYEKLVVQVKRNS